MEKKDIEIRDLFTVIRKNQKLTQEEFAKTLKVSRSTIAKIENKEIFVSKNLLYIFLSKYSKHFEPYNIFVEGDKNNIESTNKKLPTFKERIFLKIKDYFEEIDNSDIRGVQTTYENPNNEFNKNMERLVYLERENEILKAKIETQNKFIEQLINKNE